MFVMYIVINIIGSFLIWAFSLMGLQNREKTDIPLPRYQPYNVMY